MSDPHISDRDFRHIDLLPSAQQQSWQDIECWSYRNDGERPRDEWRDGPRFLGLTLREWVASMTPGAAVIPLFAMKARILRWKFNHPDNYSQ